MFPVFTPLDLAGTPHGTGDVFPATILNGVHPSLKPAVDHLQARLQKLVPVTSNHGSVHFAQVRGEPEGVTETEGKMFGVLVVKNSTGKTGYLAAFSGKLYGQWCVDGFVPPPFDVNAASDLLSNADQDLKQLHAHKESLQRSPEYLRKLQAMEKLQQQFEHQMSVLQQQHRLRKQQRAETRASIAQNDTGAEDGIHAQASTISHCEVPTSEQLARQSQNDKTERKQLRQKFNSELLKISVWVQQHEQSIRSMEKRMQELSRQTQQQYFAGFRVYGAQGETISLQQSTNDSLSNSTSVTLPPAGTAECAAPKLLSYAYQHGYAPLYGTEFWWGPSSAGRIRHHRSYYAPCHSKCKKLLPRMLAQPTDPANSTLSKNSASMTPIQNIGSGIHLQNPDELAVEILFEDNCLAVVAKPAGLLSVPGKSDQVSLFDWAKSKWPDADGPLLVHRLDMDTSGLVLIAMDKRTHKQLQKQFIQRSIKKRYVALVAGRVVRNLGREGTICLPLRVDLDDRPRQMVCRQHGLHSETCWKILEEKPSGKDGLVTRLLLEPLTGRTHQLRVHLASPEGLGLPIIGDPLYAPVTTCFTVTKDNQPSTDPAAPCNQSWTESQTLSAARMMLHAESLEFFHPEKRENLLVTLQAPF